MADILSFACEKPIPAIEYSVDVTLDPETIRFTVNNIRTDTKSLLKVAEELERIARIIRTDVVVGI